MDLAVKYGIKIALISRPGSYIVPGMELARANPPVNKPGCRVIQGAFSLGRTRTPDQDAMFAFLQVADVALRALSPSVNDPLTAMMCIDRITAAMCSLADRELPASARKDPQGKVRITASAYNYRDLVKAAYGFILDASSTQPEVMVHLRKRMEYVRERAQAASLRRALEVLLLEIDRAPMPAMLTRQHHPSMLL
jgi:uncharacterized membrane protein